MEQYFQHQSTSRARLLYDVLIYPGTEWQGRIGAIDYWLLLNPKIKWANPEVHFYFFPKDEIVWVGREIIGPPPEEAPFYLFESTPGESWVRHCELKELENLSLGHLWNYGDALRQQSNIEWVETWKISMFYGPWDKKYDTGARIEYFKQPED